jgi:uncharacterized membrane protein
MSIPAGLLTRDVVWLAAAVLVLLAIFAAWRAPWRRLVDNEQSHVWLGAIILIALLWSIAGGVGVSLRFHLLGATVATLMFGPALAFVTLALAGAAVTAATGAAWSTYPAHVLLSGAVPIAVTSAALRFAEAKLPPNYFIYIFVVAFVGGALSMAAAGAANAAFVASIAPGVTHAGDDLLPMLVMLGFGEGTLSGMLLSLMVVYRPAWVGTFSDARYLARRD